MKSKTLTVLFSVALLLANVPVTVAQTTAFTYQGRLVDNGTAASGIYELRSTIYDAAINGNAVSASQTNSIVNVSNGLFTVQFDFGPNVFNGGERWLEIGVRTNGSFGPFVPLDPRQHVSAAPYAIQALNAGTATIANTANIVSGTNITGSIPDSRLSTNVALLDSNATFSGMVSASTFAGTFNGNGAGLTNVPGALPWRIVSGTNLQAASNTGYIITNNLQVTTVTLPLSPNIGDTVRISGAGTAAWTIAQNIGQTILAKGATAFGVGSDWSIVQSSSTGTWSAVAVSADGTKIAVTANVGNIWTSTDSGVTWTARASTGGWNAIASSASGNRLAATLANGNIFVSSDSGATWTSRASPRQWRGIASSADGTKLAATVTGGQIWTSVDAGVNWTPFHTNAGWLAIACSADGTKLVASDNGYGQVAVSYDSGTNWTTRLSGIYVMSVACSADGTRMAAADSASQIWISTDSGTTWTARGPSQNWRSIASSYDGMRLAAVASGGQVWTSNDGGMGWLPRENNRTWAAIACSADGATLAATANDAQKVILVSQPRSLQPGTSLGTSGYLVGGNDAAIELQYIGKGRFRALSHEGTFVGY